MANINIFIAPLDWLENECTRLLTALDSDYKNVAISQTFYEQHKHTI